MQPLAPHFSNKGRQALKDVAAILLTMAGMAELVEKSAQEIALADDERAERELVTACKELEGEMKKRGVPMSDQAIRGAVISIGEMIVTRREEIRSSWGRA